MIDSIGLDPQSAMTLYIYRVGKTYPVRKILITDLNLLRTLITVEFLLDRSDSYRISYSIRPVRPFGQTG